MISEVSIQSLMIIYPVLRELSVASIRNIKETSYERVAQAGQILFDLGEDCDYLPLLKSGSIRVVRPFPTGWEMLLYRVLPGQVCILTVNSLLSGFNPSGVLLAINRGIF
jgi:CRP/FNR family transcriptional regulator